MEKTHADYRREAILRGDLVRYYIPKHAHKKAIAAYQKMMTGEPDYDGTYPLREVWAGDGTTKQYYARKRPVTGLRVFFVYAREDWGCGTSRCRNYGLQFERSF